jgi:hypothetical protein
MASAWGNSWGTVSGGGGGSSGGGAIIPPAPAPRFIDAIEVRIAAAVVAELTAGGWSTNLNAQRSWNPWLSGQDLTSLQAFVLPLTIPASTRQQRGGTWEFEYGIVIDLQQSVDLDAAGVPVQAEIDALSRLAEQVMDFYRDNHQLTGLPGWYAVTVERPEIFVTERLFSEHVWESWLELTFRGYR